MASTIIFNADDLGIHPDTSKGIFESCKKGLLRSTTAVVNMPNSKQAILDAKNVTGLNVGIHLNIIQGKSILDSSKLRLLTNENGEFFRSHIKMMLGYFLGKFDKRMTQEILDECEAQVQQALKWRTDYSHFDSHRHIHIIPQLYLPLCELMKSYGLNRSRKVVEPHQIIRETDHFFSYLKALGPVKGWYLDYTDKNNTQSIGKSPDIFLGLVPSGRWTTKWMIRCLEKLKDHYQTIEVGVHPGYPAKAPGTNILDASDPWAASHDRKTELDMMVSPELKHYFESNHLISGSFHDL